MDQFENIWLQGDYVIASLNQSVFAHDNGVYGFGGTQDSSVTLYPIIGVSDQNLFKFVIYSKFSESLGSGTLTVKNHNVG